MRSDGERVALAAFLAGSVLAGGNAVCIRISNRELERLWGAGLRFTLAAVALGAVAATLRLELPRGRALAGSLLYGALTFGGAFALAYFALVRLHAGLGQVLLALVPLLTLLLAVAERQERLRRPALAGAVIALTGVVVLSRTPLSEGVPLVSLLAAVGGSLCFAQGALVVRRFPPVHPVTMNAVGMAAGAVLLLAGSLLAQERLEPPRQGATWAALGYLVAVGSIIVFVLYLVVLRYWAASRAAYEFALIPVVTIALSAWLDDEPVTLGLVLGSVLVLAGVWVGALRRAARGPAPAVAAEPS